MDLARVQQEKQTNGENKLDSFTLHKLDSLARDDHIFTS